MRRSTSIQQLAEMPPLRRSGRTRVDIRDALRESTAKNSFPLSPTREDDEMPEEGKTPFSLKLLRTRASLAFEREKYEARQHQVQPSPSKPSFESPSEPDSKSPRSITNQINPATITSSSTAMNSASENSIAVNFSVNSSSAINSTLNKLPSTTKEASKPKMVDASTQTDPEEITTEWIMAKIETMGLTITDLGKHFLSLLSNFEADIITSKAVATSTRQAGLDNEKRGGAGGNVRGGVGPSGEEVVGVAVGHSPVPLPIAWHSKPTAIEMVASPADRASWGSFAEKVGKLEYMKK